jgi:nitroreductase
MELRELLQRRRMVRSFDATPVDPEWLDALCAESLLAPSAGNSAGVRLYTLSRALVPDFFNAATDETWRQRSRRAAGLARCGAVVVVTSRPGDYTARYGEPDKASSGLDDIASWPLPYWHTDAAMVTMALLLLIEEGGWHATLWGNFRRGGDVLTLVGARDEELFCSVLIGRGDGHDVPSTSLARKVPPRRDRVRRVG